MLVVVENRECARLGEKYVLQAGSFLSVVFAQEELAAYFVRTTSFLVPLPTTQPIKYQPYFKRGVFGAPAFFEGALEFCFH